MLEVLAYVFEVLVLTAAYWVILRVFRHTRGIFTMFSLIAFCGAISLLTTRVDSPVFSFFANGFLRSLPLIILIIFQEEIRRFLAHPAIWFRRIMVGLKARRDASKLRALTQSGVDELMKAVCCLTAHPLWRSYARDFYHIDLDEERLSSLNTGALIAIEGVTGLAEYREAGVALDCRMNYRLLRTIFYTGTPLHDGGVILKMTRAGLHITAAGCRFPPAFSPSGPIHTRQNAVRGLAERTNAFVMMVSEETGSILIPNDEDRTRIHRVSSPQELREELERFFTASNENNRELCEKADAPVVEEPPSPVVEEVTEEVE